MRKSCKYAMLAPMALCLATLCSPAHASDGGWEWIVAPYAWLASINTDMSLDIPPAGGTGSDLDFHDVLDKLDGAFQIHAEGQGEDFGMFADFTYLGLADDHDFARFHSESDLDSRLFELAAVWSPGEDRYRGWEVFAGLRYLDADLAVELIPVDPLVATTRFDDGKAFYDFMLGARYTFELSDRWGLTLRGDGSFGDTDGTWNASAIANLKTDHGAWFFGYRYLDVGLKIGDTGRRFDLTMSGPIIGYGFAF